MKAVRKVHMEKFKKLPTIESVTSAPLTAETIPSIQLTNIEGKVQDEASPQKNMKTMVQTKMQVGSKFGKC